MCGPSPHAGMRNWRDHPGTRWEKLRIALRNNALKLRTGQRCCGNHGEPGC